MMAAMSESERRTYYALGWAEASASVQEEIKQLQMALTAASERERELGVCVEIANERKRQIEAEGWTLEHDDLHENGAMAKAAACYAWIGTLLPHQIEHHTKRLRNLDPESTLTRLWPWHLDWWKPKDKRRNLIRAGALIVAEIERLDRAALTKQKED